MKKRELVKEQHEEVNDNKHRDNKLYRDNQEKSHKLYKNAVSEDYNKINIYDLGAKKDEIDTNENKRDMYGDEKEENEEKNEKGTIGLRIKSKRNADQNDDNVHKDEVKVSANGDNDQVASIKVDNTPDEQTRLAHNADVGKHLFLEPDVNASSTDNISAYAHKGEKIPPPQKVTTNRIDRSGLDELSFIGLLYFLFSNLTSVLTSGNEIPIGMCVHKICFLEIYLVCCYFSIT